MPAYIKKSQTEILREVLTKLRSQTSITATGAGSIARAFSEAIANELGDMYDILDYNIAQSILTTATGSALDALGGLYGVTRNTVNELAAIDKKIGAFQFYLSNTLSEDFIIPRGTNIYSSADTYMGRQFSYSTTEDYTIPAGRLRVYASIKPNFIDTIYTAGPNTLTEHDMTSPGGATLLCNNPKVIAPSPGFEDDDNFRLRIIKSIRVRAGGTGEAIRFAALGVQGVRDVTIRQAPYGMGSFEAIIVPEVTNSATNEIMRRAEDAMSAVRPMGVRMYVKSPTRRTVSMEIQVVAPSAQSSQVQNTVPNKVAIAVRRYINSLLPGQPLIYNILIQNILNSSELVRDVSMKSYAVDGQEVLRRNYQPANDEQLVVGGIIVRIVSS